MVWPKGKTQAKDLIGMTFNRLTVIERSERKSGGKAWWRCQCECGGTAVVTSWDLKSGHTKSCGCHNASNRRQKALSHGYNRTPTYYTWSNMLARCSNPKASRYEQYGGRGIAVCDRWLSFENFLNDMGERPEGLSLDRIDPDGGYSKENCRWASTSQQSNNRRNNVFVDYEGKRYTIKQLSDLLDVPYERLRYALRRYPDSWLKFVRAAAAMAEGGEHE